MELLANYDGVPRAAEVPAGAVVLALRGTERTELKRTVILWGLGALTLGFLIGRWTKGTAQTPRATRRRR